MKVYITGHTSGIGKDICDLFEEQGYEVIGFSRTTGYDLERDIDTIVDMIEPESIFVNNTFENDVQKEFIKKLHNVVGKMIVSGTISARYVDPNLPEYSQSKKELEEVFFDYAFFKSKTDYLMLGFTSSSFRDPDLIKKSILFWLDNPDVIELYFNKNPKT